MIIAKVKDPSNLMKTLNGHGGFQTIMRRLQSGYNPFTNDVIMSFDDQERIMKAIDNYGIGGWQARLLKIFF